MGEVRVITKDPEGFGFMVYGPWLRYDAVDHRSTPPLLQAKSLYQSGRDHVELGRVVQLPVPRFPGLRPRAHDYNRSHNSLQNSRAVVEDPACAFKSRA